jgi:hypothetical protein
LTYLKSFCILTTKVIFLLQFTTFFFFFLVLGFELRAYTTPFLWQVFSRQSLSNYLLGWFQTTIILISTSWVARITGMCHWHPTLHNFLKTEIL